MIACPICDDQMVWVDNGPNLKYTYCRNCKKELKVLEQEARDHKVTSDSDADLDLINELEKRIAMIDADSDDDGDGSDIYFDYWTDAGSSGADLICYDPDYEFY